MAYIEFMRIQMIMLIKTLFFKSWKLNTLSLKKRKTKLDASKTNSFKYKTNLNLDSKFQMDITTFKSCKLTSHRIIWYNFMI